jgi:hypothetical protein
MTGKMTSPPDVIYLQWYGEPYYDGEIDPDAGGNEVTWCEDEIWDVDIKYLLATPEREVASTMCRVLKKLVDKYVANSGTEHAFVVCITPKNIPEYWQQAQAVLELAGDSDG